MGFAVETVLIRGRPSAEELSGWARLSLPRLRQPQVHLPGEDRPRFDLRATQTLEAAPRHQAKRPEDLTLVWIANATSTTSATVKPDRSIMTFRPLLRLFGFARRDPAEWPRSKDVSGLPALPSDPVAQDAAQRNPFLASLALLAKSAGHASAFFADGSVSDSGCLFVPDGAGVTWSAETSDKGRRRADELLRALFGADAPTADELQWAGGRKPFWSKRLVSSGRRVDDA